MEVEAQRVWETEVPQLIQGQSPVRVCEQSPQKTDKHTEIVKFILLADRPCKKTCATFDNIVRRNAHKCMTENVTFCKPENMLADSTFLSIIDLL